MSSSLCLFSPPPDPADVPSIFPDPFGEEGPCPLARRAAAELIAALGPRPQGQTFGVLVVRTPQGLGYLRAFAGTLDGAPSLPGFAPPLPDDHGLPDCPGPKLLTEAHQRGFTPLALAELWWGPPPDTGGRQPGAFYPSCRGCRPLLAGLLAGLPVAAARPFAPAPAPAGLDVVYEDRWLIVVDKPAGLLSVPGKGPSHADCVQSRLCERWPAEAGPRLAHRLDLDTSGLLVAARDAGSYVALQRQFTERTVRKRYVAWLEGAVAGEQGVVDLPLRVDLDDRPRQISDPIHGKPAITEWQVLARAAARTRVALFPRTGRTHQLRAHAAHPRGLGAPIAGDRLYGWPGDRLLLHAEELSFVHPASGQTITFERPAPF